MYPQYANRVIILMNFNHTFTYTNILFINCMLVRKCYIMKHTQEYVLRVLIPKNVSLYACIYFLHPGGWSGTTASHTPDSGGGVLD